MKNITQIERHSKIVIFSIIIILLLSCANLVVSNSLATTGEELNKLHIRKNNLIAQNNYLKNEVIHFTSLALVEKKALISGFQRLDNVLNLTQDEPVAMNQP